MSGHLLCGEGWVRGEKPTLLLPQQQWWEESSVDRFHLLLVVQRADQEVASVLDPNLILVGSEEWIDSSPIVPSLLPPPAAAAAAAPPRCCCCWSSRAACRHHEPLPVRESVEHGREDQDLPIIAVSVTRVATKL